MPASLALNQRLELRNVGALSGRYLGLALALDLVQPRRDAAAGAGILLDQIGDETDPPPMAPPADNARS